MFLYSAFTTWVGGGMAFTAMYFSPTSLNSGQSWFTDEEKLKHQVT